MSRARRYFPFLSWPQLSAKLWRSESLAGFTVGLMLIPQAVAYAALAGMPLITGIYAALLPALVAVLFSASHRLAVGPTALTATLVFASLSGLAEQGSPDWVNLAVWLSLMSGALQLLLGFAGLGWLLNLISSPVLSGFTQAAAIFIVLSQVPALMGMGNWSQALTPQHWHLPSFCMGLGSCALLWWAKRWRPSFPTVLLLVVVSAVLSVKMGLPEQNGLTVGALPQGLPEIYWPSWIGWDAIKSLLVPAMAITMVSFMETASSAKVDNDQAGKIWDQDQDLIGQGLAKIASGLSGAFPTSSSFSRSALNLYAGAQTGWANLVQVGIIVVCLQYLTPILQPVPQSVLAAIVIMAVWGLLKPEQWMQVYRVDRMEALTALITLGGTLFMAPQLYWGVLLGLLLSLSHFLYLRMHPRIIEVGLHPDGSLRDRHLWKLPPLGPSVLAIRMDAALDFATAAAFEKAIVQAMARSDVRHLVWFANSINRIDVTGTESIARLEKNLIQRGITFHISGMKLPVETSLHRAGCLVPSGQLRMYRTDVEAMNSLKQVLGDGVVRQGSLC